MSGFFQRNRGQFRGQDAGGSNFNQGSFQAQGNLGRQQMMNPWQSGIMPVGGGIQPGRADEATLAFNILNQVLASDTPIMNTGLNQGGGFQDRKGRQGMGGRLQDRRSGQSPQFSNRNKGDGGRQWSRSRSPQRRDNRSNARRDNNDRNRKSVLERLGKVPQKNKSAKEKSKEGTPAGKRRKSRDRQSSEDKSTKGDSKGKDADSDKQKGEISEEKLVMDKENEEQLVKCLKCHVCEVDSFESIESFRNHKKSEEHKLLLDIYNQRCEAALQLMRADAKLAANREREKSGNANRESFYTRCPKCDCIVADAFKSHKKSIEHELVDNHVFRECCGSTFIRRKEFEDHRLTIPHLKRQIETRTDNPLEEKVVMAFTEEEEAASSTLREFKDKHRLDLESPADFPIYDPEKPIGLGYVHKKRRYNCTACNKSFPSYNNMALAHCRSFNHYLMLMKHLEGKLKEVEDDEMPEEEEKEEDEETVIKNEEENTEEENEVSGPADEKEEENQEMKDEKEEEVKEDEQAEGEEDVVADEEMGENMPPLDDGAIDLEEKAADDETTALEPDNEFPEEDTKEDDASNDDVASNDGQENEPADDGAPEEDSEVGEEKDSSEVPKEEETEETLAPVETVEEEEQIEEEEPKQIMRRRPARARRSRVLKHF